jgi:hypothetical protein
MTQETNAGVLTELANAIFAIEANQDAGKIVKEIDKLVYEAYAKFYKIREEKQVYRSIGNDKRGHCC